MAKKRKKKGPAPAPGTMTRKTWKDTCRRIIRCFMVVLGVFLLLVAFGIPVANNAIALVVERDLKAMPLPERTTLVESSSVAGRFVGNGNGMQYFGALLVKSELTAPELLTHYSGEEAPTLVSGYVVVPYTEETTQDPVVENLPLTTEEAGEDYYVIYQPGDGIPFLQGWLDMDLRGH